MSVQIRQIVKIAINQYVMWLSDHQHGYSSQCPMFAKTIANRDRICRSQIPKGVTDLRPLAQRIIQARDTANNTRNRPSIDAAILWFSSDTQRRQAIAQALKISYVAYKMRALRGIKWLEYYFIQHHIR